MTSGDDAQLTIDELAQRTGMTARNIRAHQSRGLLDPPAVRGRTGYYGPEHVARVELIRELQQDGFSLELIGRLLDAAGGSSAEVLSFRRALHKPFVDERPRIVDAAEVARSWQSSDVALLRRAEELGIMRVLDDGRIEERSPRLLRAGEELAKLGLGAERALDLLAALRRQSDAVAELFVEAFLELVWAPFESDGRPAERLPQIRATLERLHPLATDSLLSAFQLAMDDAVERALGRELRRIAAPGAKAAAAG